jgi:hypothetical protein
VLGVLTRGKVSHTELSRKESRTECPALFFMPGVFVGAVILGSATGSMPVAIVSSIAVGRTLLEWIRKSRIRKAMQEAVIQ